MGHLNWVSQIEEKVKALAKRLGKIQVFFEYYGKGIVNKAAIPYRNDEKKGFVAYDILLLEEDKFLEYPTNFEWLDRVQLEHVKVMTEGTFEELLEFNTDFKSPLAALSGIDTYAEGIVLKPFVDLRLNTGERVILKRISERFAENRPKAAQKQELSLDESQVQEVANAATDVRLGKVAAKFGILPDEKQKFAVLIQELANDIKEDLPHIELSFIKKQIPAVVKAYFGM
jgi:Rnl2 family RNA ligase